MENVSLTIKIPIDLKSRIDELARKTLTNRNHWIVRTLNRQAYKHYKGARPTPKEHRSRT